MLWSTVSKAFERSMNVAIVDFLSFKFSYIHSKNDDIASFVVFPFLNPNCEGAIISFSKRYLDNF